MPFHDGDTIGLAPPAAGPSASRAVLATSRLRQALERAADSLAQGRVDALLESEGALEFALADIPAVDTLGAGERAALRIELAAAERALLRCRRLGANLTDYVRLTLASHTHLNAASGYTPGRHADAEFAGRGLNARV
jgi:hypothetical protein